MSDTCFPVTLDSSEFKVENSDNLPICLYSGLQKDVFGDGIACINFKAKNKSFRMCSYFVLEREHSIIFCKHEGAKARSLENDSMTVLEKL